jgi:hypothetical protein
MAAQLSPANSLASYLKSFLTSKTIGQGISDSLLQYNPLNQVL